MDTTNSSEKPQRRVKHGQRPTEPLADWPAEFGAAGAEHPVATSGDAPADLLTEDDISRIWQSMPGQPGGFLKSFGYWQFAKAVETAVIARIEQLQARVKDGE